MDYECNFKSTAAHISSCRLKTPNIGGGKKRKSPCSGDAVNVHFSVRPVALRAAKSLERREA